MEQGWHKVQLTQASQPEGDETLAAYRYPVQGYNDVGRQMDLITEGIERGFGEAITDFANDPKKHCMYLAGAAVAGIGLGMLLASDARGGVRGFVRGALKVGAALDVSIRGGSTAAAMGAAWIDPASANWSRQVIADNLGRGLFDYLLFAPAAGTGFAVGRFATRPKVHETADKVAKTANTIMSMEFRLGVPRARMRPSTGSDIAEAMEMHRASTVHIKSPIGNGSGVFVGDDLVLTNKHVTAGGANMQITAHDGKVYQGQFLAVDRKADLSLWRIIDKPSDVHYPSARIGKSASLQPGDEVFVVGHPDNSPVPVVAKGGYLNHFNFHDGRGTKTKLSTLVTGLEVEVPHLPGNSGSGMYNKKGELVSILSRGDNIATEGATAEHVSAFLQSARANMPGTGWIDVTTSTRTFTKEPFIPSELLGGVEVDAISVAHRTRVALANSWAEKYKFYELHKPLEVKPVQLPQTLATSSFVKRVLEAF